MNAVTDSALDTSIRVDGKRLWDSLMTMAKIGATPKGGVCRLALTDLDKEGPRPDRELGEGSGLHGQRRPDGQRLHAPRRAQPGRRAGHDRLARGLAADRRPLRRHLRRAGRSRSDPHAQRSRHRDRASGRSRDLDQRGRLALRAGHGRLGRVRRRVHARLRAVAQGRGRQDDRRGTASASAMRATCRAADGSCMRRSNCISNRGRFSKPRTRPSAS